jgi:hypothetical protein
MGKKQSDKMNIINYRLQILCLLSVCIWGGCEQSDYNCLKNNGKTIIQERILEDFDSIDVRDYVNLIITQDSVNRLTVETGQNIMDGIITEVKDRQLLIRNNNKCNWLRSYDIPVNVYISVRDLKKIYYLSSGNITTTNTIKSANLIIEVWGGCGTIDMDLDIFQGYFVIQMGTVDFKLHGRCAINTIYSGDYGPFNCKDLVTGYSYVTNASSNDCYVNVSQYLEAKIGSIGNIYYTGEPDSLDVYINGEGSVIRF